MGTLMIENDFSEQLIHRLAERYEEDPTEYTQLPQPTVASSFARQTVSELRNEGLVEEEVRGVIRPTRGLQGVQTGRRLRLRPGLNHGDLTFLFNAYFLDSLPEPNSARARTNSQQ